jgi:hypothetical protein
MLESSAENGYLPPGEHPATLDEIEERFATNIRRREIMVGLRLVVDQMLQRGVQTIWVDGGFVTDKPRPKDVDVVYVPPPGADTSTWGSIASNNRQVTKDLYKVDLWTHPSPQGVGRVPIKDWFQLDRSDVPKGIIALTVEEDTE